MIYCLKYVIEIIYGYIKYLYYLLCINVQVVMFNILNNVEEVNIVYKIVCLFCYI